MAPSDSVNMPWYRERHNKANLTRRTHLYFKITVPSDRCYFMVFFATQKFHADSSVDLHGISKASMQSLLGIVKDVSISLVKSLRYITLP